jgi:glycosyltransferase involved in cell wall biosynthesis
MTTFAFVSDSVFPFHKGGKEMRLYEIAKRMVSADTEVHIYTMKWWDGPTVIQRDGVYYHALCRLYPLYTKDGRRSIVEAIMFGLATLKMLFARFDVMDVDSMPFYPLFSARVVCTLRRKKLIATWHEVWGKSYWQEYMKGPMGLVGHVTEWLSFRLPDVIISNSLHTTERLHAVRVKAKVVTVPLGVDVDAIRAATPSSQKSDVIYVGRFLSHKNVPLLVDALALVQKVRPCTSLLVIGNGPDKDNIMARVKDQHLESVVTVRSDVHTDAEKYMLLAASSLLVLPSEREGFGLVMIEANAAGLPAITVNCPDNAAKDLITEGVNGSVVDLTAESLAQAITSSLSNRHSMDPARDVSRYDWATVARTIQQALMLERTAQR